jgi:hypothetical protein
MMQRMVHQCVHPDDEMRNDEFNWAMVQVFGQIQSFVSIACSEAMIFNVWLIAVFMSRLLQSTKMTTITGSM